MEKKSARKILYKQLELLAEDSKRNICYEGHIANNANAMCKIYKLLIIPKMIGIAIAISVIFYLLIG